MDEMTSSEIRKALARMVRAGVQKKVIAGKAEMSEGSILNITNAHVARISQRNRLRLTPIIREWESQQTESIAS